MALPEAEFAAIRPLFCPVQLRKWQVLQESNRRMQHAFFITRGVASLLISTKREGTIEVAVVGRLGFVGVPILLGTMRSPHRCLMHVPGEALRIAASDFEEAMRLSPRLRFILNRYVQALLIQQSQVSLCNARHKLEERLARWLLVVRDRLGSEEIPVTHRFAAQVLGVRRASVTLVIKGLEEMGAVAGGRGHIMILDASKLEAATCECYAIILAEYSRIFDAS